MIDHDPARRAFLIRSAMLAAGAALPLRTSGADEPPSRGEPGAGLVDTSASPHVAVRSVGLGEVSWTRGFWADRFAACREVMVPNLWRVMSGTEPSQFLHNFRIAAGLAR